MSIKNLLTDNLKPDQDLIVDSITANTSTISNLNVTDLTVNGLLTANQSSLTSTNLIAFGASIDFQALDWLSTQTATLSSQNAIIEFANWPSTASGSTRQITINYTPVLNGSTITHVTLDANGTGTGTPANRNCWLASIENITLNSFVINCTYLSSSGASDNTFLRLHITIIPTSVF